MKLFHVFRFTKKSFLAAKKHNKENEEEIRSECTGGDAVGGRVTDITNTIEGVRGPGKGRVITYSLLYIIPRTLQNCSHFLKFYSKIHF